ncbi:insulin-like growth factor-binding complex acid labile subunit isoform X1 [Brachionus plicatilis]|uniref:Insulin-like growth factor-binding complex acid labile subunit isoform X1 n=1 Tax=Brachionus plicatilis TaxID=10195 RepID=A0A3M7PQJ1_BRAPC|nr:insulin-like growth factor-binding complex acid labile subunit isoform X1 [Brachionus plicatilis]
MRTIFQLDTTQSILPNYVFNVVYCKDLDLSKNQIQSVKSNTFTKIKNLESLILSSNKIKSAQNFYSANLSQLISLNLAFNQIELLNGTFSVYLKNLKYLDFNKNLINFIRPDSFKHLISIESINLSNNKLIIIPCETFHSLSNLATLNLGFNKIENFCSDSFKGLKNLKKLYLTNNNVKKFTPRLFSDLSCIETLNIGYNKFTFEGLTSLDTLSVNQNILKLIDSEAFFWLKENLTKLYLNSNLLYKIEKRLFSGMIKLEILDIKSIEMGSFSNLPSLKKLFIQQNNLKALNTFDLPQLTILDLSDNYLETLPPDTFKKCLKLKRLFLDKNRLDNFSSKLLENVSLDFLGLNKNYILDPSALPTAKLEIKCNKLESINNNLFAKSKTIDLSHNKILSITNESNYEIFFIKKIYLQFNKLKKIDFLLSKFTNLDTLDLRGNLIEELKIENFKNVLKLNYLNLSFNPILHIEPGFFKNLAKIKFVDVSDLYLSNQHIQDILNLYHIKEVNFGYLKKTEFNFSQINKKSLKSIYLNNLNINYTLDIDFRNFPFLELMDASFTRNKFLDNIHFYNRRMLRSLEMSGCGLSSNNLTNFNKFRLIKHLNLSFNNIEHLNTSMFEGMHSLGVLDLRNNQIKSIEENIFYSFAFYTLNLEDNFIETLQDLKILFLHNNQIKDIDVDSFDKLTMLENLNLANNSIKSLPNEIFKELISLKYLNLKFLSDRILKNLFNLLNIDLGSNKLYLKKNSLYGLKSIRSINMAYITVKEFKQTIIKSLIIHQEKVVNGIIYYKSLNIRFSDHELDSVFSTKTILINLKYKVLILQAISYLSLGSIRLDEPWFTFLHLVHLGFFFMA